MPLRTKIVKQSVDSTKNLVINPWFTTGLTDAEGSFLILELAPKKNLKYKPG